MKKYFLALLSVFCLGLLILNLRGFKSRHSERSPFLSPIHSQKVKPKVIFGKPAVLIVPKLNVQAEVEEVGMDAEGKMAVPKKVMNVAWFAPGYRLGEEGNVVLAGHFDQASGAAAVFYQLESLEPGDPIIVKDTRGRYWHYRVSDQEDYLLGNFPMNLVFGSAERPKLNLITCSGDWDQASQLYSRRLVVFADWQKIESSYSSAL